MNPTARLILRGALFAVCCVLALALPAQATPSAPAAAKEHAFGDALVPVGVVQASDTVAPWSKAELRERVREVLSKGPASLRVWVNQCLRYGRLLWFGEGLKWPWLIAGTILAFYLLLALIFRAGVGACVETFEQAPGHSILAAAFAVILTPLFLILLIATGIGTVVLPVVLLGLVFAMHFGRASLYAWCGRRLNRRLRTGPLAHVAVSVLFGGILLTLLACVPVLGLCLHGLISMLGFGLVVYTVVRSTRKERPAPSAPAALQPAVPAPPAPIAPAVVAAPLHGSPPASAVLGGLLIHPSSPVPPPPVEKPEPPYAGFCPRLGAWVIDILMCGLLASLLYGLLRALPMLRLDPGVGFRGFLLLLVVYNAVLWKVRGATIGGLVFDLRIVRLDEAPLDWMTIFVRVLGSFISLAFVGLGFIWIALDRRGQAWHDKIANTAVLQTTDQSS